MLNASSSSIQRRWRGWGLDTLFLLALAAGTVNRYAPEPISGDVMLYSVMSLQKVTLFFWAQNRLLNVGPALTSLIHDPTANLWANLLFPTLVFYALLRAWAGVAVRLVRPPDGGSQSNVWQARVLFLMLAAAVLLVLRPQAVYEVVVWHVEYPLACLLLLWAYGAWFSGSGAPGDFWPAWPRALLAALLLGVAMGVNFSTVIPALALAGGRALVLRRLDARGLGFAALAVMLVLLWWMVARTIPGPSGAKYAGFSLTTLREGWPQVLGSLWSAAWRPRLEALLAVVLALRLLQVWRKPNRWNATVLWVQALAALFALGWLLLFAGNAWVQMNAFHYRYFVFALLALGMVLSLELAKLLVATAWSWRGAAAALALLWLGVTLVRAPVPLQQYAFAQRLAPAVDAGATVYAGDFSLAWSAVVLGMLQGRPAFGVAGRAEGNARGLQAHVASTLARDGRLEVVCLQATVDSCVAQVNAHAGRPMRLRDTQLMAGRMAAWRLVLEQGASQPATVTDPGYWSYHGAALASLNSLVGYRDTEGARSLGEEGFLLYGPYREAPAGRYRLQVFGTAQQARTAWVDVAARVGSVRYAQFALRPRGDVLVDEVVHLPRSERDLEVRVYVGAGDVLRVTGYEWRRCPSSLAGARFDPCH